MKILLIRHDDPDGFWSAASVIHTLIEGDAYKDVPINYGKEDMIKSEDIEWADQVYILDFTCENMPEIVSIIGPKLVWIDHHKTSMEKFPDLWNDPNVKGIRSIEKAACRLTWEYLHPGAQVPGVIIHVADKDIWRFEYLRTRSFCMAESLLIHDWTDDDIKLLMDDDKATLEKFYQIGELLYTAQKHRIEKAFEKGIDFTFHGLRARLVNTSGDISEIGEYIYTKPEYDIAVMWQVVENKVIVSLRSNTVDCAQLAEKYGGGGHSGAAGFQMKDIDFPILFFGETRKKIGCSNDNCCRQYCADCILNENSEACGRYQRKNDCDPVYE